MHHATNGGSLVEQKIRHALAGVLVAGILPILTVGAVAGQAAAQATRTDTQGIVTVKAVYVTPAYFKTTPTDALAGKVDLNRNVVFAITLDTHAGDLSKYDFVKNVTLRNNGGPRVAPLRWVSTAEGPHHRAGGLVFPKTDQTGRPIDAQAKVLELIVRGLGGVAQRTLRWTLPIP